MALLEDNGIDRRSVLGTCHHDCPDSCGWVATSENGVLVELKGNPEHPFSRGELCPKVNRFVHRVNHDDRLLRPLIRTGPKGSGEFEVASWEDAIQLVVGRVRGAVERHGGETIYPWSGAGAQGAIQRFGLHDVFFEALGASKQTGNVCGNVAATGMATVYGAGLGADPLAVTHADHIILWGTNTRLTNRHLWPFIEQARARGARVVAVDPVRTMTAASCDEHIQILPGTDVALLLAMIHVLVRDDLIDREYLDAHADGWDELAASTATTTPEWASTRCGIEAEVIESLAAAYGHTGNAFIRALVGAEHQAQGGATFALLSALPVITGKWRFPGGGFARSVGAWPELEDVNLAALGRSSGGRRGLDQPRLGAWLTDPDLAPPIEVLFAMNGNPLVSMPNAALVRQGLAREDLFTVVHEQFMTDTALYADVIFPAAMQTEQHDVVPAWGHLWLGWNEPATPPMGESVSNSELYRRLAAAFALESPVFEMTDLELIDAILHPDVDSEELRRTGFVRVRGTEAHMPYADGGFRTASGRATLPAVVWDPGVVESDHPITLLTAKQRVRFLNASYGGIGGHREREADPVIDLDPVDAADRGLAQGDLVRVFNGRAELRLPVNLSDRVRPGVAVVPWGYWAEDGQLANDLTDDAATDIGGGAAYCTTRVQIEPVVN